MRVLDWSACKLTLDLMKFLSRQRTGTIFEMSGIRSTYNL